MTAHSVRSEANRRPAWSTTSPPPPPAPASTRATVPSTTSTPNRSSPVRTRFRAPSDRLAPIVCPTRRTRRPGRPKAISAAVSIPVSPPPTTVTAAPPGSADSAASASRAPSQVPVATVPGSGTAVLPTARNRWSKSRLVPSSRAT